MHELTEWKDRDDELVGTSVFLTAEEVKDHKSVHYPAI
jgi:hypothetical protein